MNYHLINKDRKDYYRILYQQYKNSKFILKFREEKDCIKSRLKHITVTEDQCKLRNFSWNELGKIRSKLFRNNIKYTVKYFKNRESDLLKFNKDIQVPKEICEFFED